MDVNEIYVLMQDVINKSQNGYFPPDQFNNNINVAQRSYMSWLLGSLQTYQPGRPISLVELGQNTVVRQRLTPSIYQYNLSVDSTGYSPYPGDYLQADAMWSIYGYQRVRSVEQDRWYSFYNSVIDPVADYPIYMLRDIGFQFAPENIGQAKLSYVRNPPDIVWAYDEDPNGLPVYNATNSIQPIWSDLAILEVIVRALAIVGINLQASDVFQYSQLIKSGGQ